MATISPSEAGRALRSFHRAKEKVCPECGKTFVAVGPGKYCSPRCRNRKNWRDWFRRQKARANTSGAGAEAG